MTAKMHCIDESAAALLPPAGNEMKMTTNDRETQPTPHSPASTRQWRLVRIDIRSPVMPNAWPIARLELEHPTRGRVTDIGKAPGAFDAAFLAASQILQISPALQSYNVRSDATTPDGALKIMVEVQLQIDGQIYTGTAAGVDLVRCSLEAWLDAVACQLQTHS